VRGKRLHHYVGSYSSFLTQREERAALAAATAASKAAEIARLEEFVARFGAKASKASEAQSKLKVGLGVFVCVSGRGEEDCVCVGGGKVRA
jgi:ATPase subunit of ABC transporter with duplicated ATPase domains